MLLLPLLRSCCTTKREKIATSRALTQSKRFHKMLAALRLGMVMAQRGISWCKKWQNTTE